MPKSDHARLIWAVLAGRRAWWHAFDALGALLEQTVLPRAAREEREEAARSGWVLLRRDSGAVEDGGSYCETGVFVAKTFKNGDFTGPYDETIVYHNLSLSHPLQKA